MADVSFYVNFGNMPTGHLSTMDEVDNVCAANDNAARNQLAKAFINIRQT